MSQRGRPRQTEAAFYLADGGFIVGDARFYVPSEAISGDRATIRGDQARHLVSVLRKKPGDGIVLFDGQGTLCDARIVRIERDLVVAIIERKQVNERTGRRAIELFVAVPKGRRFDLVVEKATELGADSITPLLTARSVVKLDDHNISTRLDRWRRVSVAASKQCRRSTLPRINAPISFSKATQAPPETSFPIMLRSFGESPPIYSLLREVRPIHHQMRIYVGPEGGFSPEETETARKGGIRFASLGRNILRTETAAIASLAVVASFLDRLFTDSAHALPPRD